MSEWFTETPEGQHRRDHPPTTPGLSVTTFSSAIDDTPEGMFRMDRLEETARQEREAIVDTYGPGALAALDRAYAAADHALLFGTGSSG